jgi:glycosyltransferase involved in cell wall biosynthesis
LSNKKPIKILHITEAWKGGIATYVEDIVEFQVKSGDFSEVHLFCSDVHTQDVSKECPAQIRYYKSSRNLMHFFSIAKNIQKAVKEISPDIVHLHSTFAGVYGRLFNLRKKNGSPVRTIYCAHGWSFSQDLNFIKKWIYIAAERFMSRNTDGIINTSRFEYKEAKENHISAPYNSVIISCIADAIKTDNIPIAPSDNTINIGFIGRFDRQKGFDFLSRQMALCGRKDIKMHIIGGAVLDKDQDTHKNSDFNYLGWVDYKVLDDYIKCFDAIVIPPRWEGFCLVGLIALRNGKAIIVSDRASLPEIVIEGYNGYIFSFDEPATFIHVIEEQLNKQELQRMGRNSRAIYEDVFAGERQHCEITNFYKRVI